MHWFYSFVADALVVVHLGYVAFVVLGLAAVLVGAALGWQWTRDFWFRVLHLVAIGVVVLEALAGWVCPLTTWEQSLRQAAGQTSYEGQFVATWVHRLLFFDAPPWVFTLGYCAFGAAVLAAFVLAPPKLRRKKPMEKDDETPATQSP